MIKQYILEKAYKIFETISEEQLYLKGYNMFYNEDVATIYYYLLAMEDIYDYIDTDGYLIHNYYFRIDSDERETFGFPEYVEWIGIRLNVSLFYAKEP